MTSPQKTESSRSINIHRELHLDDRHATLTETVSDDERKVQRKIVVPAPKRKPGKTRLPLAERQSRAEKEAYRVFQQETGQCIKPFPPRPDKRKLKRITRAEVHLKSEQQRVAAAMRQSQREISMMVDDEGEGEFDDEISNFCKCNSGGYPAEESYISQRELDREISKAEAAIRNEQELQNVMDNIDEYYLNVRDELEGLRETAIENRLRGLEGFRELTREPLEYGYDDTFIDVDHEAEMTRVEELIEKMSNKLPEQRRTSYEDEPWDSETSIGPYQSIGEVYNSQRHSGSNRMAAGEDAQEDEPRRPAKGFDVVEAKKRLKNEYTEAVAEAKGRIKNDNDLANYLEYLSNDHDKRLKALIKLSKRRDAQKPAGPPVEPIKLQPPVVRPGQPISSATPTRASIVGKRIPRKLSLSSIPEISQPVQYVNQAELSPIQDQEAGSVESRLKEQVNMMSQIERLKLAAKAKLLRDSQGLQPPTEDPGELQRTLVDLRSNLIEDLTGRSTAVGAEGQKESVRKKPPKKPSVEEQVKIARQIQAIRAAQAEEAAQAAPPKATKTPLQAKKLVKPAAAPKSAPTAKSSRTSLTAEQQIAIARAMAREAAARRELIEKLSPAQKMASTKKLKSPATRPEAPKAMQVAPPKSAPTAKPSRTSLTAEQQIAIARAMAREAAARREEMEKSIAPPKTPFKPPRASASARPDASKTARAGPPKSAPTAKSSRVSLTAEQQIAIARAMAREAAARREEMEKISMQPKTPFKTPRASAPAQKMAGTGKLKSPTAQSEAPREAPDAPPKSARKKSSKTSLTAEQQIAIARAMAREAAARREEMEKISMQPKTPSKTPRAPAPAQRTGGTSKLKSPTAHPEAPAEAPAVPPKSAHKKSSKTSLTAEQQIAIARALAVARREEMEKSIVQPKTPFKTPRASAPAQRTGGTSKLKSPTAHPEAPIEAPAAPPKSARKKSSKTSLTAEQQVAIARALAREAATRREEMEKSIVQPKTPYKTPRASASAQKVATTRKPKSATERSEAPREVPAAPPKSAPKVKSSRSFLTAEQQIAIARAIARGEPVQLPQVPESPVKRAAPRVSLVAQQSAMAQASKSVIQPKTPRGMPTRPPKSAPTARPSRVSLVAQQAARAEASKQAAPKQSVSRRSFGVPPPSESALRVAATKKLLASASRPPKSAPTAKSSRVSLVAQQAAKAEALRQAAQGQRPKKRSFGVPPPSESALRVAATKKLLASASRPPKSAPSARSSRVSLVAQQAARAEALRQAAEGQRPKKRTFGAPPPSESAMRVAAAKKLLASASRAPKSAPTARPSRVSLVAQQAARAEAARQAAPGQRASKRSFGVPPPSESAMRVAAAKKLLASASRAPKSAPTARPSRVSLVAQQAARAEAARQAAPGQRASKRTFGVPPPSESAMRVAAAKKLLASASRAPKSAPTARPSRVSLVAQQAARAEAARQAAPGQRASKRTFGVPPPSESAMRVAAAKKLLASASRAPKSAPTARPSRVSLVAQQAARAEAARQAAPRQQSTKRSFGVPPASESALRVAAAKKLLASASRPSVSRITPKTAPTARSSRVSLVAQQAARADTSRRETKSAKTLFGANRPSETALRVAAAKKMSKSRAEASKVDLNELSVKAKEDYEAQKELAKRLITDEEMYQDHLQYLEEDYSSKLHFIKNMETYKSSAEKKYMKDVQAARASIRDKDILKERLDHLKEELRNKKAYIEEAAGMSKQRAFKSSAAEVKGQLSETIHQLSTGKTPKQAPPSVSKPARGPYRFFDTPKGRPSLLRKPTRTTLIPPSAAKGPATQIVPTQRKSGLAHYQKYLQDRQNIEELYKDDPHMLEHHLKRIRGEYDANMAQVEEEPGDVSTLYKTPGAQPKKSLPALSASKSVRGEKGIPTLQARKSTTPIKSLQKARLTSKSAQGERSLLATKLKGKNVKDAQGKAPAAAAKNWKVPVSIRGAIRKEKKLEKSLNRLGQAVESNKELIEAVEGPDKPTAPISKTSLAPLAARMGLEPDKQVEQVLGKASKMSRAIKKKMSSIPPTVAGTVQQKDHSSVSPLAAEEADGIFKMMMNEEEGVNLSGEPGEIVRLIVPSEGPTLPVTGNAVESLSKGVITDQVPVREINALSNRNAEDFASTVKQQPKHKFPMESIATKRLQEEQIEVPPVGEPRSKEDYIQHDLLLHSFEVENFFQARGTTFPKWFPGIYTVFPEESPKLVLKKSPSEVLHRAWQIMKPKYARNSP